MKMIYVRDFYSVGDLSLRTVVRHDLMCENVEKKTVQVGLE